MSQDLLTRLYYACSAEDKHMADGLNLGELYERTKEAEEASILFSKELFGAELSFDAKSRLEELDGAHAEAREEQGFRNGFRLGMKLAEEVLRSVVAEKSADIADLLEEIKKPLASLAHLLRA